MAYWPRLLPEPEANSVYVGMIISDDDAAMIPKEKLLSIDELPQTIDMRHEMNIAGASPVSEPVGVLDMDHPCHKPVIVFIAERAA